MQRCNNIFSIIVFSSVVFYQERTVQSLMQRHQVARPAERAGPIRHVPTQLWRCWVVCWWCCVSPPPGWVPLRWLSWPFSRSPVPSSSLGSAATGTFSSSPSTTLDMRLWHGRSRPPYRNSGKLPANFGCLITCKLFQYMCSPAHFQQEKTGWHDFLSTSVVCSGSAVRSSGRMGWLSSFL